MQIPDEWLDKIAWAFVATGIGGSWAWKRWLRLKAETRSDNAGQTQQTVYQSIIEQLELHIERLEARVLTAETRTEHLETQIKMMNLRVTEEINQRYLTENANRRMESEANGLRAAVADLIERLGLAEAELRQLRVG